jgi:hypothetical protein
MRITPEQACANYAADHQAVKEWTAIMKANPCTQWEQNRREIGAGVKDSSECISLHWTDYGVSGPMMNEEEMCSGCRASMAAYFSRKIARKRLGASKRTILAVGKRLNAGGAA